MAELTGTGPVYTVEAAARIEAAPERLYGLIADYVGGHPRIVPPQYFRDFVVRRGGYGAGTEVEFSTIAGGRTRRVVAEITEPVPGRVLVETIPSDGVVTTFRVEPAGTGADVTIATDLRRKPGLAGTIEKWLASRLLPRIYREELARLADVAREAPAPAAGRAP